MKIPITILLLASLFAASCGEPPMPPSDEEMIRHNSNLIFLFQD